MLDPDLNVMKVADMVLKNAVTTVRTGFTDCLSRYKSRLPDHSPSARLERTPCWARPLASLVGPTYGNGADEMVRIVELPVLTLHLHSRHSSPLTQALNTPAP
jgi:hypothetical protein